MSKKIVTDKMNQEVKIGDWIANAEGSNHLLFGKVSSITKSGCVYYKISKRSDEFTTRRRMEDVFSSEPCFPRKRISKMVTQYLKIEPTKEMIENYER